MENIQGTRKTKTTRKKKLIPQRSAVKRAKILLRSHII